MTCESEDIEPEGSADPLDLIKNSVFSNATVGFLFEN